MYQRSDTTCTSPPIYASNATIRPPDYTISSTVSSPDGRSPHAKLLRCCPPLHNSDSPAHSFGTRTPPASRYPDRSPVAIMLAPVSRQVCLRVAINQCGRVILTQVVLADIASDKCACIVPINVCLKIARDECDRIILVEVLYPVANPARVLRWRYELLLCFVVREFVVLYSSAPKFQFIVFRRVLLPCLWVIFAWTSISHLSTHATRKRTKEN
jgi:hypothetical protein